VIYCLFEKIVYLNQKDKKKNGKEKIGIAQ